MLPAAMPGEAVTQVTPFALRPAKPVVGTLFVNQVQPGQYWSGPRHLIER